jgi:hypothetical protein
MNNSACFFPSYSNFPYINHTVFDLIPSFTSPDYLILTYDEPRTNQIRTVDTKNKVRILSSKVRHALLCKIWIIKNGGLLFSFKPLKNSFLLQNHIVTLSLITKLCKRNTCKMLRIYIIKLR